MPIDSATRHAVLGADSAWDLPTHLMAAMLDALHVANWQTMMLNRKKGSPKPKAPKRVPRPGVQDVDDDTVRVLGRGTKLSPQESRAIIDAWTRGE